MRKFLGFFGLVALILVIARPVGALTTAGANTLLVGQDTIIDDVYAAGGGTVDLTGTFNDDVLVGGGNVTISGPVKGDILVGGGTVKITGSVDGNIRASGGTVDIEGTVGRNVLVAGGTVTLSDKANINGEVTVFTGNLTVNGHVAKDLNAWGGSMVIGGKLDGDVNLHTGDDCGQDTCVTVGPSAVIGGNFSYWAAQEATMLTGASIKGTTTFHPFDGTKNEGTIRAIVGGFALWSLLSSLLVAALLAWFLPKTVRRVADHMVTRFWPSVSTGTLVFFVAPIAMIILAVTVIGIPIALILVAGYLIDLYLAKIFLGYLVGMYIWRRATKNTGEPTTGRVILISMTGVLIVSLVFDFLVPFILPSDLAIVGGLISLFNFCLLLWSFGALVTTKWKIIRGVG